MAVKTTYELFNIVGTTKDYKIQATDKDGVLQTVISSDNAKRYILRKYGTRKYTLLTGSIPATAEDAEEELNDDFRMWLLNRQHNIDLQYQALFDYDYSPIENYDRYEVEESTTDDDTTYGRTNTASGTDRTTYGKTDTESGTDTTTYGKTDTLSGADTVNFGKVVTEGGDQSEDRTITRDVTDTTTKSGTITKEIQRAGFNSPNAYTPAEKETESYTQYQEQKVTDEDTTDNVDITFGKTVTDSGDEETEYGKVETLSGSDTVGYGHTVTQSGTDQLQHGKVDTLSGKDQKDIHQERELHAHGNIGVTTSTYMISELIEMRKISLAEMLLDGFVNDYTYYS